jgi:hypothetical protein
MGIAVEIKGAAEQLKLDAGIDASVTSFSSNATPTANWPTGTTYKFVIVMDLGESNEEKMLCTGRTGSAFTVDTRGYDGTTAAAHTAQATIDHCVDAVTLQDTTLHVNDDTRDDHSQYLNTARHDLTARHTFGAAYGTPDAPANVAATAAAGTGDNPAREDHVHALGSGVAGDALAVTSGVLDVQPDGTSIDVNGSNQIEAMALTGEVTTVAGARAATIANNVVDESNLTASIAGDGLAGGNGTPLSVNVDDSTVEITTDALNVKDGGISTAKIANAAVGSTQLAAGISRGALSSGYAPVTTEQGSIGATIVDLTDLTVTVTVRSGSRLKITGECQAYASVADTIAKLYIRESSTQLCGRDRALPYANQGNGMHVIAIVTPTAGSHTYKLSMNRTGGSGTITMHGALAEPAFILVEDIGA